MNKDFMAEPMKPSPRQNPVGFSGPRPLTRQEIESLRRDKQESGEWFQKRFGDLSKKATPAK